MCCHPNVLAQVVQFNPWHRLSCCLPPCMVPGDSFVLWCVCVSVCRVCGAKTMRQGWMGCTVMARWRHRSWRSSWTFKLHQPRWASLTQVLNLFPTLTAPSPWSGVHAWGVSLYFLLLFSPPAIPCLDPLFLLHTQAIFQAFLSQKAMMAELEWCFKRGLESLATEESSFPILAVGKAPLVNTATVWTLPGKVVPCPCPPRSKVGQEAKHLEFLYVIRLTYIVEHRFYHRPVSPCIHPWM